MKKEIIVYTDGSSLGNPGDGGWGVLFVANKKIMEMGGYKKEVTNNQMELKAILKAFEKMVEKKVENYEIKIFSDSKYCINGISDWIKNWKKNGWKNSAKQTVKNKEYWENIDLLKEYLEKDNKIEFIYVKAHNGEIYNERVDDIARIKAESEGEEPELFNGRAEKWEEKFNF